MQDLKMHSGLPAKAYGVMFRTFVFFCVYMSIAVESVNVNGLLTSWNA